MTALDWKNLTIAQVRPEDRDEFYAMKAFDERIARVLAENGGEVICPRCKRPATGWPLRRSRPDSCGDRAAVQCFRDPETIVSEQRSSRPVSVGDLVTPVDEIALASPERRSSLRGGPLKQNPED